MVDMNRYVLFVLWLGFLVVGCCGAAYAQISSYELAKKHALVYDGPATDFFEGALLGNGGLGVVVTTRPDAVVLYFGHNNVWDIRLAEDYREEIGTFKDV